MIQKLFRSCTFFFSFLKCKRVTNRGSCFLVFDPELFVPSSYSIAINSSKMNNDWEEVHALLAEKQAIGETNAHSANTYFPAVEAFLQNLKSTYTFCYFKFLVKVRNSCSQLAICKAFLQFVNELHFFLKIANC